MSHLTVYVKNISPSTADSEVREFFSFCGKITDIKIHPEGETKAAQVTFEKETATKTALLLNNTQLGSTHITVTGSPEAAARGADDEAGSSHPRGDSDEDIPQEVKPRSRILAEYLAHGYLIGDATLKQAIEMDNKHGVSKRFLHTIQGLDKKYHATDRARATSNSYGLSQRATTLFGGLNSFFVQAKDTPTGQRIAKFYEEGSKEVQDIHAEARRLAELRKQEHGGSAYKAAGFERFFGKEKVPSPAPAEGLAHQPDASSEKEVVTEEKRGA